MLPPRNVSAVTSGMGGGVQTQTTKLSPEIAIRLSTADWSDESAVVVLPDRIHDSDGVTYAAFRAEAQSLRASLVDAGLKVNLVIPPGARKATYEEHDATWVLPVLVNLAQLPVGTVASVIGNWITAHISRLSPKPRVRYREGHRTPDGAIDVLEIDGPGDEVVRILRERFKH